MVRESTSLPKKSAADERDTLTLVSNYQPAGDQGAAIEGEGRGAAHGKSLAPLVKYLPVGGDKREVEEGLGGVSPTSLLTWPSTAPPSP